MKHTSLFVVALSTLTAFSSADACTTVAGGTLESAFGEAAGVVLAEVLTAARTASASDPGAPYPVESVSFKVLVTWKGSHKPGSVLEFKTAIGPGSCGISIDPEMRVLVAAPAKRLPVGGIWVLFLNGAEPYGVEAPSGKVGAGAERNLGQLYELSLHRKPSKKSST